jgi:hypothetical protein
MATLYIGNPTRQKRIIQYRDHLNMRQDLVIAAGRQIELNDMSKEEIDALVIGHDIIPSDQYEPVRGTVIAFVYLINKPLSESILRGVVEKNDTESEAAAAAKFEAAVMQTNVLVNETAQAHDKGGKVRKTSTKVQELSDKQDDDLISTTFEANS